jgi:hypothetical protein
MKINKYYSSIGEEKRKEVKNCDVLYYEKAIEVILDCRCYRTSYTRGGSASVPDFI